ncbi:MAG: ubiquinone biosynthesis hydroxylase [Salinarimonadaceae bacterium]|nr:MAG: ubiquinone biosynthesis hydroxylase [Salinarimonadaceae bacterium]
MSGSSRRGGHAGAKSPARKTPARKTPPRRIAVAGGGIAGLALAAALARACPGAIEVVVCDPAFAGERPRDERAYAIAAAGRRMLEALGAWEAVAPQAQAIRDMVITDSRLSDPVRPVFLTFDGEAAPGEPFAHMVPGQALLDALVAVCGEAGIVFRACSVRRYTADEFGAAARLSDGETIAVDLLAAADGARSRLREAAGISWIAWSYRQVGIVGTVAHERDHGGRAIEHFLPSGPFALLPLTPGGPLGHRSSIVWTEREADAPRILAMNIEDATEEVERRFGLELGAITLETPLRGWPLAFGFARDFVAPRLALIGDAAHVIHPIAGQGLNLALKDVAALAESVVDAVRLGMDPGGADVLEEYQRARRFDALAMGAATDGLNRLFSNDAGPVRMIRDLGLGVVDRLPGLKRFFIREAAGISRGGPRLLRGERL